MVQVQERGEEAGDEGQEEVWGWGGRDVRKNNIPKYRLESSNNKLSDLKY